MPSAYSSGKNQPRARLGAARLPCPLECFAALLSLTSRVIDRSGDLPAHRTAGMSEPQSRYFGASMRPAASWSLTESLGVSEVQGPGSSTMRGVDVAPRLTHTPLPP